MWTTAGEKVRGRVLGVSGDALDLGLDDRDIRLLAHEVRKVERSGDRIWNGAGIGGAIGFAVGSLTMATCEPGFMCDNSLPAVLACGGMAGAFWFGVGALGNWLVRSNEVIFDSGDRAARLTVAPVLSLASKGVTVRVAF